MMSVPSVPKPRLYGIALLSMKLRRRISIGVDAGLGGDGVDQPLAHEGGFVAAGRAIGAARRLVGQPDVADGAIGRHAIGARQHGGGEIGHGGGMRAHIGAVVVEEFVVDAENAAVFVDRRLDLVALLARVIGGDQMLAPVLDPFDRPLERQRRGADQHVFRIHLAADAEAAADMAFVELQPCRSGGRTSARGDRGSNAAPWRRRAFPGCRLASS